MRRFLSRSKVRNEPPTAVKVAFRIGFLQTTGDGSSSLHSLPITRASEEVGCLNRAFFINRRMRDDVGVLEAVSDRLSRDKK